MPESNYGIEDKIELLLDEIIETYGYDFTGYARASLRRRIIRLLALDKWSDFDAFKKKLKSEPDYFIRFMEQITVNVTEMFRDADFYKALQTDVFPSLATYPFIRIWVAGCSTGEEAYSIAIILKEMNLLHKALIYATDVNASIIEIARKGVYGMSKVKKYSENYVLAGGKAHFSDYYSANYSYGVLNDDIRQKIIFSTHNLVSDYSFNEFHLILCRNVLIYFDKHLQSHVFNLFDKSIENLGYIGLGNKETLSFSTVEKKYKRISNEKIWRKVVP